MSAVSTTSTPTPTSTDSSERRGGSIFVRLSWMILGNFVAVILAAMLWGANGTEELLLSLGYWASIGAVSALRYLDISRFGGLTADGDAPATMAHWRRHTMGLVGLASVVWGLSVFVA